MSLQTLPFTKYLHIEYTCVHLVAVLYMHAVSGLTHCGPIFFDDGSVRLVNFILIRVNGIAVLCLAGHGHICLCLNRPDSFQLPHKGWTRHQAYHWKAFRGQ